MCCFACGFATDQNQDEHGLNTYQRSDAYPTSVKLLISVLEDYDLQSSWSFVGKTFRNIFRTILAALGLPTQNDGNMKALDHGSLRYEVLHAPLVVGRWNTPEGSTVPCP